jgi:hypothetical protein
MSAEWLVHITPTTAIRAFAEHWNTEIAGWDSGLGISCPMNVQVFGWGDATSGHSYRMPDWIKYKNRREEIKKRQRKTIVISHLPQVSSLGASQKSKLNTNGAQERK